MEAQGFMRPPLPLPSSTPPPPPNMTDPQPQLQHHHQQQPPPQGNWFSGQFQYHASQPPPQPPPPPQHQQWVPPPSNSYPPLPPPPQPLQQPNNNNNVYPYHHPLHPQQQPHHHYLPPPPPSHHQHPYSHPPPPAYSQQTRENPNRVHQQSWQHPDGSNVEDWAARAKEWAAAKTLTVDNQHMQHQFAPIGRPEEHSHVYHDQLHQTGDARYADPQQPQHTLSSHQHYPVSSTNFNRPPVNHLQESTFNSGVSSSYVSDGHSAYIARDGAPGGDQNHVYPQGSASGNSSMYQQEVPSSYSSVPGAEGDGERNEQLRRSSNLQMQEGPHYMQQNFGAAGRSASLEQPHFAYGDLPAEPVATCDRPLEFTPTFSREHDPHPQPSYAHLDPIPSVVCGVVYPPVPSGVQFDPSFGPTGPGHTASMFGQITGSNFRPAISGVSTQYGLGTGISVHPTTPFIGDANGGSTVSDRPKKASVPNWLREEIIKKKASMVGSYQDHPEGDSTNPIEEETISNSLINGDQADNKSISSSRLSDDEDDDEDDMKAAKTAAHNREIKRVLTEILLKVTDELFDEIATKVIDEEDVTVEANRSINLQKQLSSPPFKTTKALAKVLIPVKGKQTETTDDSEKSSSGAAGDILGLGSYVSDEDDEDEVTVSSIQQTTKPIQPCKLSDIRSEVVENDGLRAEPDGPSEDQIHKESEHKRTSSSRAPVRSERDNAATDKDQDKISNHETSSLQSTLNGSPGIQEDKSNFDGGKMPGAKVGIESKVAIEENDSEESELPHGIVRQTTMEGRSSRSSTDHKDDKEKKRNSGDKFSIRKAENAKTNANVKHSNSRRQDQRHVRKEKTDGRDRDVSKERARDRGTKTGEKAKEDSRRDCNSKDETRETEKLKKTSTKEDSYRKRERDKDEKQDKDEREDRSRHSRHRSGRHKRPRSSSISGRGRDSKDNSVGSHADESSDEASEDSRKRKPRSKRRSTSPSPTRSRRRQVSRSPRSKHSHRRHSPHSSLESSRKRRSRSNSPVHHRRK